MYKMSTRTHSLIDYAAGAAFMLLPRAMGIRGPAAYLLHGAGMAAAAYSMLTKYERGLVPVLPMKTHLTLDALSGGMLLGAAAMMEDEDDETRAVLAGVGLFELAAALSTETESPLEMAERTQRVSSAHNFIPRAPGTEAEALASSRENVPQSMETGVPT